MSDSCCQSEDLQAGKPEDRIKGFGEVGIEEQIVRLRAEVIDLRRNMGYKTRTIQDLVMQVDRLNKHEHINDNVVVSIVENIHGIGMDTGICGPDLLAS